jgi:hypothetical protein
MPGVALIARFDGDPEDLARQFRLAAARYVESPGATEPEIAMLLRDKHGIAAVLVWPDGASIQLFRTFLTGALGEIGLPHPRVEHLRASALTWQAIAHADTNN